MKKFLASLAAVVLLMGVSAVRAQDSQKQPNQQPSQDSQQPPDSQQSQDSQQATESAPGVARIGVISGSVSTQRGDNGQWVAATVNTPVEAGDRISTGHDSRAEIQLDYANVMRMSGDATAKIANLSRTSIQVQVGQGLVTYSVLEGDGANTEIDTPNVAIHPEGQGDFRILVNSNAETQIVIRSGSAEISTPQGSTNAEAGQMITVAGTDNPEYKTSTAPERDDWDSWNSDRDKAILDAQSWQHTDRYYTGTEDLDNHGTWTEVPDYGQVWAPAEPAGWAPYRDGRWVWEPYYGWTWVSYEPWGWAPYHYGRWFVYGGNWVWWPGRVYDGYDPVWAPAYVSFFGFGGGGFGFGIGFGGWGTICWLPIGPCDWYHPWYGRWGGRYNGFNFSDHRYNDFHEGFGPLARGRDHIYSNFDDISRNSRVREGMSSMAGNEFGRRAVPAHQAPISMASFRNASMVTGRMPVNPTRESYSPTNRPASRSTIRGASPHFFTQAREEQTHSTMRTSGISRSETSSRAPASRAFDSNRGNSSAISRPSERSGWHTFTPPQSSNGNRSAANGNLDRPSSGRPTEHSNQPSAAPSRAGWRTFTPPTRESQPSRGYSQAYGSQRQYQRPASRSNNSYRPPLNMRQPIVAPRGGYSAPRGGYSAPAPRGGGYSAPRGGGYSAPRGGNSAPRGGGGGASRGSSGGGGGGSHSGGGGHSGHGR